MCRMDTKSTIRAAFRVFTGFVFLCEIAQTQQLGQPPASARDTSMWRRLGNSAIGVNLAGPAGGPIDMVWFSQSGDRLFVRTRAGQVFETTDYSTWSASKTQTAPPVDMGPFEGIQAPEPGAKIQYIGNRFYSLGSNLEVSEDFG